MLSERWKPQWPLTKALKTTPPEEVRTMANSILPLAAVSTSHTRTIFAWHFFRRRKALRRLSMYAFACDRRCESWSALSWLSRRPKETIEVINCLLHPAGTSMKRKASFIFRGECSVSFLFVSIHTERKMLMFVNKRCFVKKSVFRFWSENNDALEFAWQFCRVECVVDCSFGAFSQRTVSQCQNQAIQQLAPTFPQPECPVRFYFVWAHIFLIQK